MEIKITSNGDTARIEIDGVEIPRVTMINFIGLVNSGIQCVFEQLSMNDSGQPIIADGEMKREIHRVDFAGGTIV